MSKPTLMYIGPDRPFGLPLRHNTLLRGAPEEAFPALGGLLTEHEELRTLFVPVSELATARMLLTMPGTATHRAHAAVTAASTAGTC